MGHAGGGLVAQPPARGVQAQDEVDVLRDVHPASNPAPTAARRTSIAALGTYATRERGTTSAGSGPRSSEERTAS